MFMQKELLKVNDLKQYFPIKGGFLGRTVNHVKAVDGITFSIYEGETVSIVGESGCGKSTTGRSILRLDEPTDGEVEFDGENLLSFNKKQMRENRKRMQVIFTSEEHTSELQSRGHLVCRLLLEKKKTTQAQKQKQ